MERKRFFTADEKIALAELIETHKNVLESKKSDCISVAQKKKAWVLLTEEFNSVPEHTKRFPDQLKKWWENMKMKQKKELALEKRKRMAMGGQYKALKDVEDGVHELNALAMVDIEMKDVIDRDHLFLDVSGSDLDNVDQNGLVAVPNNSHVLNTAGSSKDTSNEGHFEETIQLPKENKTPKIERELEQRLKRNAQLIKHDQEIHELRKRELEARIAEANIRVIIAQQQLKQEKMKSEILELELSKKKS